MMEDVAINPIHLMNTNNASLPKKPPHLLVLNPSGASKKNQLFLSLDRPELLPNFVQVKGFFLSGTEEDIPQDFVNMINGVSKDSIFEMLFPVHRIVSIKNLVFKSK